MKRDMSGAEALKRIVGNEKLRLSLILDDNALYGRVLGQAKALRGKGVLADDGKYAIASCLHPGSYRFADGRVMLFIRGWERAFDDDLIVCAFPTHEEAVEALEAFERLCATL